jgi:putative oxidoreductase
VDVLVLIGRILFVLIFIGSGLMGHFGSLEASSQYAESKGVKPSRPYVIISGLIILVGGLMVLLGIWIDLGALLLIVFLVPTALIMHNFWKIDDEMMAQVEMSQFMKNIALAGAALMLIGFAGLTDIAYTITDPLFVG